MRWVPETFHVRFPVSVRSFWSRRRLWANVSSSCRPRASSPVLRVYALQSRINSTMILHIHFDELKFRGSSFREANSAVGLKGSPAGTTMTLDSASGSCVHNSHTHTQLSNLQGSVSPVLALYHHNVTLGCHGTLA